MRSQRAAADTAASGITADNPLEVPTTARLVSAASAPRPASRVSSDLRVSDNGRHLVGRGGRPFFWLGDTAWLLFQMTTREDADLYLRTRARQGFTVIQAAVVMGEERVGGTLRPNRYGDLAFVDGDPARPAVTPGKSADDPQAYDYWDHVDYIIERARAHRLVLGLLPNFVGWRGDGYKYLTPENAYAYGHFLGKRYGRHRHLFWILGGDNVPDTEAKQKVWHEMARGITVGTAGREDYRRTLMTYHISGGSSSSQWFHQAPWLDFNMAQVWGQETGIYPKLMQDYKLEPVKPMGLGEGSYENGPQYPTRPIDALKIRQQAYWSYFAGGYHTYGNTDTWNFSSYEGEAVEDWKKALESPGAASMTVLARLLPSLRWWEMAPESQAFAGAGNDPLAVALRSHKGDRLLVYLPNQTPVTVDLSRLSGAREAVLTWIDPRSGDRTPAGAVPASGTRRLEPPKSWQDALLLVEASRRR